MEPVAWVLLVFLGAWAALDGVSAGQFMVSRPLVTGTLTGLVLGDPVTGFLLGLVLDIFHLGVVPAGGARLPEPGPAAIPAVSAAILAGGEAGLAVGFCLGVILAALGGGAVVLQRRWQGRIVAGIEDRGTDPIRLTRRLILALGLDGLRGAVLVVAGLGVVLMVPDGWHAGGAATWPLDEAATWALLLALAAAPAGAVLGNLAPGRGRLLILGGGLVAGVLFGVWMHPS